MQNASRVCRNRQVNVTRSNFEGGLKPDSQETRISKKTLKYEISCNVISLDWWKDKYVVWLKLL